MKGKRVLLGVSAAALVISGAVFFAVSLGGTGVLEIRDAESGKVYGRFFLGEGGEFAIEFVHSVNKSPVREIFETSENKIRPLAVRFSSFGAGMLSDITGDLCLARDGDFLVISGFKTSYQELNYIVGTVSDHLLFVNGESISLRELCGRNAHITIRYK